MTNTSDSLIEQLEARKSLWDEHYHSVIDDCIDIIRNHKSEPVSLEKCAKEGMLFCQNFYNTWDGKDALQVHIHLAKAVLEAAGVAYVE